VVAVRRLTSILLSLALCVGNVVVCAGWAPTPEARMACCRDGQACPMHKGKPHGPVRTLTQSEADACCAASEDHQRSSPSTPTFAAAISVAVLGTSVVMPASVPPLVRTDGWRPVSPSPPAPVPKHVLLSVFLV